MCFYCASAAVVFCLLVICSIRTVDFSDPMCDFWLFSVF